MIFLHQKNNKNRFYLIPPPPPVVQTFGRGVWGGTLFVEKVPPHKITCKYLITN